MEGSVPQAHHFRIKKLEGFYAAELADVGHGGGGAFGLFL
jgi:hypothetical protein